MARFSYMDITEKKHLFSLLVLLFSSTSFQRPSEKICCKLEQSCLIPVCVRLVFYSGKSLDCLQRIYFFSKILKSFQPDFIHFIEINLQPAYPLLPSTCKKQEKCACDERICTERFFLPSEINWHSMQKSWWNKRWVGIFFIYPSTV